MAPISSSNSHGTRSRGWTTRPRLSLGDLENLKRFRLPGEGTADVIRRLIREALDRRGIDEALRDLGARLARIEAGGVRVSEPAPAGDADGVLRRTQAALGGSFAMDDDN